MVMDFRDNVQKCQEYVESLEEERLKIQVFQRELPLCLELVTQAIEACKQQLSGTTTAECFNGHSECSEQTTSDGPVLEEFIPLKRSHNSTDDDDDEEHESNKEQTNDAQNSNENDNNNTEKLGKKSDWLRSVQLWNQTPDPPTTLEEHQPKRVSVVEVKNGGAFHPFQKEKATTSGNNNKPTVAPEASASSSAEAGDGGGGSDSGKKEEKGGQTQRKARRCWSPELHRRFLHALQQLGGSHVATPKQIRELMKVDGLTNDEVKSHLQKYRLHTRRPTQSSHSNTTTQTTQFVVVGGIWVPAASQEYAAVAARSASGQAATVAPSNGIYAPVAAPPAAMAAQVKKQRSSQSHCGEGRGSHSHSHSGGATIGARRSSSPATSSSTHTTTASHAY